MQFLNCFNLLAALNVFCRMFLICFLDSFCLWINTTNLQRDLLKLDLKYSLMDFSNYPKQHPMYNEKNKNRLWYLKDETKGIGVIISFVGLGPKQYSYITLSPDNSTTQKKVCIIGSGNW